MSSGTTTSGTVAFNLPAGFRPLYNELFEVDLFGGGHGRLDVDPSGNIVIRVAHASRTALSNISFSTVA
jgi:hypothetical protein